MIPIVIRYDNRRSIKLFLAIFTSIVYTEILLNYSKRFNFTTAIDCKQTFTAIELIIQVRLLISGQS